MTSAPELTLCSLTFPYEVSYIRRRCRNTETTRLPGHVDIAIRTIADADAPVAFFVDTPNWREGLVSFDVREFEGACWWPLVYDEKFVGARQFLNALAAGDVRYLTLLLRKRIYADYGWGHWTWRRFEDLDARDIKSNNHETNLILAQRGAEDFLLCGDRVFVRGRDPVYCCVVSEPDSLFEPRSSVDVADPERRPLDVLHPQARPLGNGHESFDISSYEGTVFRADEREKLASFLETRGFSAKFSADIKVMLPQNIRSNPLQMQVAALVRALIRWIDLQALPVDSEYFQPLVLAHKRLLSIATQKQIEMDEGRRVLMEISSWSERIEVIRRYDPDLAMTFAELPPSIHDVLEKVRVRLGSLPGSRTFLDKHDEEALNGLGA